MVLEGERCIEGFRSLAGATDPTVAAHPGRPRPRLGPEGPAEPRARVGLRGVLRPRDQDLVPRPGLRYPGPVGLSGTGRTVRPRTVAPRSA
jgi:hypothetical protein